MMNSMNFNAKSVTSNPIGIKQSHPPSFGANINKQLVKDMLDIIPKNHRAVVMTNPEMGRLIVSKKGNNIDRAWDKVLHTNGNVFDSVRDHLEALLSRRNIAKKLIASINPKEAVKGDYKLADHSVQTIFVPKADDFEYFAESAKKKLPVNEAVDLINEKLKDFTSKSHKFIYEFIK